MVALVRICCIVVDSSELIDQRDVMTDISAILTSGHRSEERGGAMGGARAANQLLPVISSDD